jgi:hypothetical protein
MPIYISSVILKAAVSVALLYDKSSIPCPICVTKEPTMPQVQPGQVHAAGEERPMEKTTTVSRLPALLMAVV